MSQAISRSHKWKNFWKSLGPGLLFAGASIGVSHIVQSTRAGANYGFLLIGLVILTNIFKFPFFEYGPRYSAATGESLLQGYRRLGRGVFYLFLALTVATMFTVIAAVTIVTSGLVLQILSNVNLTLISCSSLILIVCALVLILGHYGSLDKVVKVMIVVLTIATIISVIAAFAHGSSVKPGFEPPSLWNVTGLSFLIALMGWMPAPIDISVWHSIWSIERAKQTNHRPTIKEAIWDFHIGYWGTMVMAVMFLCLGALVMYGTGEEFSNKGAVFAAQVVSLYTQTLGDWSKPIIVSVATITMLSTTLTCLDAYPRLLKEATNIAIPKFRVHGERVYVICMVVIGVVAMLIIGKFVDRLKALVDLATILSFLAAPVFALMNLKMVTSEHMPESARPSKAMQIFSWVGFVVLTAFGATFVVWKYFLS